MSTIALPTWDPRALATALRERGLPGQRSMTAIRKLRAERRNRTRREPTPAVRDRLYARLTARYVAEIARRGGETTVGDVALRIVDRDPEGRMALLHASGWRDYGRRGRWRGKLSYLCGQEDGQCWAVRVPGTITNVLSALWWIVPDEVRDAQLAGRRVVRQGDVYAVETTRRYDGTGDLPERHTWDPQTRVLSHPQHRSVTLDYPVRFVPQRAYQMGRGAGRGAAD